MDNECFELCKEVYKRTGWKQEPDISYLYKYWDNHDELCVISIEEADDTLIPAYTSDYLLEKLPVNEDVGEDIGYLVAVKEDIDSYQVSYDYGKVGDFMEISDTPLKALLKLTIALSEAGELK